MDVTFTNVLEGARQYFQGLPAATGSAASPVQPTLSYGSAASTPTTYTTPSSASTIAENTTPSTGNPSSAARQNEQQANMQQQQQQHYWSHTTNEQQQKEQEKQQLPSHANASSYSQQQSKIPPQQSMHNYQYSQQVQQNSVAATATAYQQYPPPPPPRSHSQGQGQHEPNALQYSSHYSSTTHRPLNVQTRPQPPSSGGRVQSPSPKTQNYHQLQTARHHHNTPSPSANSSHSQGAAYMSNYQQHQQQQQHQQTTKQAYYPQQQQQQSSSSGHAYTQQQQQQQPPASSQAYMPNHQFTPHSYSPHSSQQQQTTTQYLSNSSKQDGTPVTPNGSSSSSSGSSSAATHNLPPIAALYHSNKSSSRDAVQRLSNHRHHRNNTSQPQPLSNHASTSSSNSMSAATVVSTTTNSTMAAQHPQQQQHSPRVHYTLPSQGGYHPPQNHHPSGGDSSTNYQYPQQHQQQQVAYTTTTSSLTSTSTSSTSMYQSSYSQHLQKLKKHVYQQDLNQKPQIPQQQQQPPPQQQQQLPLQSTSSKDYTNYQQSANTNRTTTTSSTTTVINTSASNQNVVSTASVLTAKQKRESPLDLSVKTVRTSADSTASVDDSEVVHSSDSQRINKFYGSNSNSGMPPPPAQAPQPTGAYNPYEMSNHQRISTNIRATTPAVSIAGGAPKVDFLPNFNVQQHPRPPMERHPPPMQHSQIDKNPSAARSANMPPYNSSKMYYQQSSYVHPSASYPHSYPNMMPSATHPTSYNQAQVPSKRSTEVLPRIEFPTPGHTSSKSPAMYPTSASIRDVQQPQQQPQRKRPSNETNVAAVPNKMAKHDSWRQTIDQQIEQRFSSYTKQQQQQVQGHSSQYTHPSQHIPQQPQQHHMQHLKQQPISNHVPPSSKQQMINGNMMPSNHHRSREQYVNYPSSQNHHSAAYAAQQMKPPFANSQYPQGAQQAPNHSQTYVPTMSQYPYSSSHHQPHPQQHQDIYHHQQQQQQHHQQQQPNVLSRSNSNPKLSATERNSNSYTGADKRVLSILRNSLEIKGAKEAQRKIEQGQQNRPQPPPEMHHHMRTASGGVQQPKMDVQAPLQPKHGISRQNVSPFPAANLLERTTNTPPAMYKIHFPRAVDSVRFETETMTSKDQMQAGGDMYTLAAAQDSIGMQQPPATGDASNLDGLAAFLAARIRTKAELKQVGTNQIQNITSNSAPDNNAAAYMQHAAMKNNNQAAQLPRRRLFSRSEEEAAAAAAAYNAGVNVPTVAMPTTTIPHGPIRDSAIRSSSETSVFDFRDSDSESEVHVLERQSLGAMRKDRRTHKTLPLPMMKENEIKTEESKLVDGVVIKQEEEEFDPFFSMACDKFLEQLKTTGGKKRGRRKKKVIEPEVLAKLETVVTKENNIKEDTLPPPPPPPAPLEAIVKLENIDLLQVKETTTEVQIKTEESESKPVEVEEKVEEPAKAPIVVVPVVNNNNNAKKPDKIEDDSDSDVPLARRTRLNTPVKREIASDDEDSIITPRKEKLGAKIKIEYSSDSSVSDSETIQSVSEKLRSRKQQQQQQKEVATPEKNEKRVLRSADSSPSKKVTRVTKKKAIFGDGSDFHPGWEEEVYKYKRSLRMPARLINITRAPQWHRMSTSLPDLDPCSPAASSLTDDTEFSSNFNRRSLPNRELSDLSKLKRDILDSDIDSNSSFTFSLQKGSYDSEASCSSLKSTTTTATKKADDKKNKENNNSIIDVLAERYSKFKRKRKGKDQKQGPKIIPKSADPLELLPTPSLGIGSPEKDKKVGRNKNKTKEEANPLETNNSIYLGFFRKETVNNFRDTFKKNSGFMGMGEPFSTVVLKSRTRTETRVMKQRATIREVFGEERPASAPPIACREDELSQDSIVSEKEKRSDPKPQLQASVKLKSKENNVISPIRAGLRSANNRKTKHLILTKKLRARKQRPAHLIKVLTTKKALPENTEEKPIKADVATIKSETVSLKSETPSEIGDESTELNTIPTTKRRLKLRNIRRKFSSGFDYIRKKKKIIKKETIEADGTVKVKRRGMLPRPSPESVQDIQREIKTWVMNKGIGETHLHRAARLGYTDITVYCLEKMDCVPSPKDNAGYTPLHEACSRGHLDIARVLLQYGANVSESAQGGIRPLHEAAENGYVEIIRLLLSYGADPTLATYSGLTPLSLATDEETKTLLKHYMADIQGLPAPPWSFKGPASCFDPLESGYDPLNSPPSPDPIPEDEDLEIEMSEQQLPNLYILRGEPVNDRWILLQDLSAILKIKSRDTLLRQLNGSSSPSSSSSSSTTTTNNNNTNNLTNTTKNIIKELKFSDFMEQAHCCQLLCANEKINARSSKIALVKYTDKVKQLLGVERVIVTTR